MIQVAIEKYKKVQESNRNEAEKFSGKIVKIKGFPGNKKVKIFWIMCGSMKNKNKCILGIRGNSNWLRNFSENKSKVKTSN